MNAQYRGHTRLSADPHVTSMKQCNEYGLNLALEDLHCKVSRKFNFGLYRLNNL
jgi:hypothetical protein